MPTPRYSSIWDRWRGDHTNYSESEWAAWLAANYPGAIARYPNGGYVSPHKNPRRWGISPGTLAEVVWLYFRGQLGATQQENAANARAIFSLSDHEALQMGDIVTWITAAGNSTQQMLRWRDFSCFCDLIEQRANENKAYFYGLMSVRADSASG